jgi:hypothetical protein
MRRLIKLWLLAVCTPMVYAGAAPASANDLVAGYLGSWGGKGKLVFKNGSSERINCRAYNTGEAAQLRLALRCASPGYKIEIRSRLNVDGSSMSGTWEERTYNVSGAVRGRVGADRISLNVDGGAMRGDMNIAKSGSGLSVAVETAGIDLRRVTVRLAKLN